jgi:hypothetical protein
MAEVLLTHSNNLYSDRQQIEKIQPYPPLQTILAAPVLREQGIEAALFDPTIESPGREMLDAFEGVSICTIRVWWWFAKTISTFSRKFA